ncbi:MAG: UbiX family flavin prenyltransferase [bacterium]
MAITGASGAIYAHRLLRFLYREGYSLNLVVSDLGRELLKDELCLNFTGRDPIAELGLEGEGEIFYYEWTDLGAPIASGSFRVDGMVIVPCSMKTLAGVAHGLSSNLIERAADVVLKEGRPLIVVPREMPLNIAHIRNMLSLAEIGGRILPAMPAFYHRPESVEDLVDFVVGKVLDAMGVEHDLFRRWK